MASIFTAIRRRTPAADIPAGKPQRNTFPDTFAQRLCNLYERIPEQIHGLNAELEQAKKQLSNAKEQYGKPFQYEEQLRAGLERQAQINAELEVADKPHDEAVMSDYSDDENEEMEM